MRAVAESLRIAPLNLPWAEGPRLWRAEDIAAHLPLFKDYPPPAGLLAKASAWDESKHPRWPSGSRDHQGGQFQSAGNGAGASSDGPPSKADTATFAMKRAKLQDMTVGGRPIFLKKYLRFVARASSKSSAADYVRLRKSA
jgi:hypothetical protein